MRGPRRWDASLHKVTFRSCCRLLWWLRGPAEPPALQAPLWRLDLESFNLTTAGAGLGAAPGAWAPTRL